MDREEVRALLTTVKAVWPMFDISNEAVERIWESILGALTKEEAFRALQSLIADGREFPPTPGHILKRWRDAHVAHETAGEAIDYINRRLKLWRPPPDKIQHHPTREEVSRLLNDRPRALRALLSVGVERWRDTAADQRAFLYRDFAKNFDDFDQLVERREQAFVVHKGLSQLVTHLAANALTTELDRAGAEYLAQCTQEERQKVISKVLHGLSEDEFDEYREQQKNDARGAQKRLLSWVGEVALSEQRNELEEMKAWLQE